MKMKENNIFFELLWEATKKVLFLMAIKALTPPPSNLMAAGTF